MYQICTLGIACIYLADVSYTQTDYLQNINSYGFKYFVFDERRALL